MVGPRWNDKLTLFNNTLIVNISNIHKTWELSFHLKETK